MATEQPTTVVATTDGASDAVVVEAVAVSAEPTPAPEAQAKKVEVELKNVEAAAVAAEDADDTNQLSKRAVSKRQQARQSGVLKATHVKGQYIRDPNYKPLCSGISTRDWIIIMGLFLFAYCFNCMFLYFLLELGKTVGNPILYIYFGLFLFFLAGVGFLVYTGYQERAEMARIAKKEAAEAKSAALV